MGSLSVSTQRGLVHWQGLLLVVSLLSFWCLPTNAQFSIVSTNVAEGEEVRLILRNKPQNVLRYRWFRGEWELPSNLIASYFPLEGKVKKGSLYEDRMILDTDGTLLIKKAAFSDAGMYTVVAYLPNEDKEIGFGRLKVYRPVEQLPFPQNNKITVLQDKNIVMSCLLPALSIEWFFNGMALQLSNRRKLSEDGRTLTIRPVHMEDAGYYQCKVNDPLRSADSCAFMLYVEHE
ncbi:carcinoembryonic antigen-related cell adhesion molecule 21-like [Sturnira hondurensis]|uniref:carcinoembryonic antigen-related cell adhesion molecule 21-like n=1 Tax=Sturnira hondurensis TaxID=192404 RepID=UPI001879BFF5|nr:carcinoembryonic antigen-related cell adhesion molecule 21-like [Sturnira hondurensis]